MGKRRIPEGWTKNTLGDIANIKIGGTPPRNQLVYWDTDKSTNNLWVSIKDLEQKYVSDTTEYITDLGIANSNAKRIESGTILLSFKLTIGKVAIACRRLYTNEAIAALEIKDNNETNNKFLFYGLQFWDLLLEVDQAIKGATLNKEKLNRIEFFLPKQVAEQSKIAEILSTVDEAIDKTEALIQKYQRIKQGLMQDLLTKGIDENGNIRSEETHKFKDSPLGRIPEEWEVVELGNIEYFDLMTGGTPSTEKHEYWGGDIPWLSSGEVHNKRITSTEKFITKLGYRHSNATYIPLKSILVALAGQGKTRGTCAITEMELTTNQSVAAVIPNQSQMDSYYVYHYLDNRYIELRTISAGAGRAGLSLGILANFKIKVPRLPEQKIISEKFNELDLAVKKEQAYKQKLLSLKSGLMEDLLTGKVRVNSLISRINNP